MLIRRIEVPEYIYNGRLGEALVPDFEQQYFKRVDYYDKGLMAKENGKAMAKRIGYNYIDNLKKRLINLQRQGLHPAPTVSTLGDEKFAWEFLRKPLSENSVIYCFGLGVNMTFEDELARETGAIVHCFDPTRQAVQYSKPVVAANPLLRLNEVGISNEDKRVRFYHNPEPGLGSLSIKNIAYGDDYEEFEVRKLSTLMKERGHSHIDLLKFDVEGAEYDVIYDLEALDANVDQLCLEFDQPVPPWKTQKAIEKLSSLGYYPISILGLNFLFVHARLLDEVR